MELVEKKAQVSLFIIIAIIVVTSVILITLFIEKQKTIPTEFQVIENYFLGCIKYNTEEGARILGEHGGYIKLPKFEPGSAYMPFSSQLNFFGSFIPYWFYISGNNIMKSQVPSLTRMEKQLSEFLEEEIEKCDFSDFKKQGYNIITGKPRASVKIKDNFISVVMQYPITISKGNSKSRIAIHKVEVKSKLGKFYNLAKKIYEEEQSNFFLENKTLDVLYLYAPTNNVELSCAPKVWLKHEIERDVKEAIAANIGNLKLKGSYYKVKDKEKKYFIIDFPGVVDENINFLYSPSWPTRFKIWSSNKETNEKGEILVARPIGLQKGLGILGFCYLQYHFIYDIAYPVLVQIFDSYTSELFQFPMVIYINKNKIRKHTNAEMPESIETDLCKYKITPISIYTYTQDFKPIEANISFKCLNEICKVGQTTLVGEEAVLKTNLPQCLNGFIIASSDGYAESKLQIDTNREALAELILQPLYNLSLEVLLGGVPLAQDERAIVTIQADNGKTQIIAYPQQKSIQLKEGNYRISLQIYRKGEILIGEQKTTYCVKVPASGIKSFFGIKEERCYDIDIPSQTLTEIIVGGGTTVAYFMEEELKNSDKLTLIASIVGTPKNLFELYDIYTVIEENAIDVSLK